VEETIGLQRRRRRRRRRLLTAYSR